MMTFYCKSFKRAVSLLTTTTKQNKLKCSRQILGEFSLIRLLLVHIYALLLESFF
jgi:hypothetical protein